MRTISQFEFDEIKRLHGLWLANSPAGVRANMRGVNMRYVDMRRVNMSGADMRRVNMSGADMSGADMSGANMSDATGNMQQVKSAQFDTYRVVWTQSPEGVTTLSIGCQSHPLEKWKAADPRWIAAMASDATAWWERYGRIVIELVEASPAVPWGKRKEVEVAA